MKPAGILVVALCLLMFVAFARYETVAPCGMLRSELKRKALVRAPELTDDSGFAIIGFALGAVALDRVIEARTGAMGPIDCLGSLANLHTRGLPVSFSDDMRAMAPSPGQPVATQIDASASSPTWEYVSTTDPIDDSVFSRAAIITDDGSLWLYLASNVFQAGLRPDERLSSSAREIEFRVDGGAAFSRRITSQENRNAFVTLTEAQVDQILGGTELLVRYQGLNGPELLRFPLTDSAEAIRQLGRPRPAPPPPRPPDFSSLTPDERVAQWEKAYSIGAGSSTAKNAAAVWQSCISIEGVGPPPNTAEQRTKVLDCAIRRGFPLK